MELCKIGKDDGEKCSRTLNKDNYTTFEFLLIYELEFDMIIIFEGYID